MNSVLTCEVSDANKQTVEFRREVEAIKCVCEIYLTVTFIGMTDDTMGIDKNNKTESIDKGNK